MQERRCGKRFDLSSPLVIPFTGGHTRVEEFRGFLAMAVHVRSIPPTHTHTQRGIAAEQYKENEMCHSPLDYNRCRCDSIGVRIRNCELLDAPSLRRFVVGKLPHSHRLCSKCVGDEEGARKKLRRSPLRTLSSSSSPSSLFSHTTYAASV